jgi:hypothetical protein
MILPVLYFTRKVYSQYTHQLLLIIKHLSLVIDLAVYFGKSYNSPYFHYPSDHFLESYFPASHFPVSHFSESHFPKVIFFRVTFYRVTFTPVTFPRIEKQIKFFMDFLVLLFLANNMNKGLLDLIFLIEGFVIFHGILVD